MASVQWEFAQGIARCGMYVGLGHVADVPSVRKQQTVNQNAGAIFKLHVFWATSFIKIELFSYYYY